MHIFTDVFRFVTKDFNLGEVKWTLKMAFFNVQIQSPITSVWESSWPLEIDFIL